MGYYPDQCAAQLHFGLGIGQPTMGKKHPNWRRIKTNRTYSTEDMARTLDIHKNTIRNWMGVGLRTVDDKRPYLFRGAIVIDFLRERRQNAKRPLLPGQIYCLPCHAPKSPALDMVDIVPLNEIVGNLCGLCPDCSRMIHRRVSLANLASVSGHLEVTLPNGPLRIRESG